MSVGERTSVTLMDLTVRTDTVCPTSITISMRVLDALERQERTPEELAWATGLGCVRIQNRLNLQSPWSLAEVEELSRVFGLPWAWWFDDTNDQDESDPREVET